MVEVEQHPFYEEIPTTEDWTRLLILEPGDYNDPIVCSVYPTPFRSAEYEAISYVWGNPANLDTIICSGHEVEVTANLVQSLHQVRRTGERRHLWVDALCINQRNLQEKSFHVNMMGAIYSHAQRVIICLGDDGQNGKAAKIAFDVIRDYNRIAAAYMTESLIAGNNFWKPTEGYGSVTGDRLIHAVAIFEKPWFTRVWILQEVGLAKEALAAYGGSIINLTEIMEFAEAWAATGNDFEGVYFASGYISSLFNHVWATFTTDVDTSWYRSSFLLRTTARVLSKRNSPKFEDVLFKARNIQSATDPRDFIYAFLGHPLARDEDGELLVNADYTRSMDDLRLYFFRRLACRSLRFLGLVWHDQPTCRAFAGAPSWCPHLDVLRAFGINGRYSASRRGDLSLSTGNTESRVSGPCLEVSIYVVDTVFLCGELAGDQQKEPGTKATLEDVTRLLARQPSLAEGYWAVLEATENQKGLAYPDKALAFASVLLHTCDADDREPASIAHSFEPFCREHCPKIQAYLDKHKWLDRWAGAKTRFIPFAPRTSSSIKGEKFFTTIGGRCGTGSPLVQPGDLVCLLPSVQMPLVIRPVEGRDKTYHVVGSSFVYGLMYGEALATSADGRVSLERVDAKFV